MHGIIFSEFRQYAEARIGPEAWPTLVEQAGLANRLFLVARQFPDLEFQALVVATATRMGKPLSAVLEDRAVAAHYGEGVRITESTCVLLGADCCTIGVEVGPHLT